MPPCQQSVCIYSEGVLAGWRGLLGRRVAFPFGHGLSFTQFGYEWTERPRYADGVVSLQVLVTNQGAAAGAEVAQLYLRFPAHAAQPERVLRAFAKTPQLAAGEATQLCFRLGSRDLSVWEEHDGGRWALIRGAFEVLVGASSQDIRLQASVTVTTASASLQELRSPPPPPPSAPPSPHPPHLPGCKAEVLAALQDRRGLAPGKTCFRLKTDALACNASYFVWADSRGVSLCLVDDAGRCRRGKDMWRCDV